MIFVGIDVAKDKHDCFILNSEGTVLADVFTIANNRIGFETLLSRIQSCSQGESKIKVGLEATGHYSYNLLGFLLDSGLATYVINPLHTNLYRKSLSLRRTKTDRIDARILKRKFINFASDKDHLDHVLNRIKRQQREQGPHTVRNFWRYASRLNDELAKKIAAAITEFTVLYSVHTIVFEYLDFKGKKRGTIAGRIHRHGQRRFGRCCWP